jgi:hypothetical protein
LSKSSTLTKTVCLAVRRAVWGKYAF